MSANEIDVSVTVKEPYKIEPQNFREAMDENRRLKVILRAHAESLDLQSALVEVTFGGPGLVHFVICAPSMDELELCNLLAPTLQEELGKAVKVFVDAARESHHEQNDTLRHRVAALEAALKYVADGEHVSDCPYRFNVPLDLCPKKECLFPAHVARDALAGGTQALDALVQEARGQERERCAKYVYESGENNLSTLAHGIRDLAN